MTIFVLSISLCESGHGAFHYPWTANGFAQLEPGLSNPHIYRSVERGRVETFIDKDTIWPYLVIISIGVRTGGAFYIQRVKGLLLGVGGECGNGGKIKFSRSKKKKNTVWQVSGIGFDCFETK